MSPVQWPAKGYDPDGADLSAPMKQLLVDLRLLENPGPNEKVSVTGTPASLQILTAGATSLSKLVVTGVGVLGGLGAVATGLNGFFVKVGPNNLDTPLVRTAFILAGALIAAAVALCLAIVVRADVGARAAATAAQFEARAAVAAAALHSYALPPEPSETKYVLRTADGSWHTVKEFRWEDNKAVALVDGDKAPYNEWKGLLRVKDLNN
jgi:hypothetical protein